MMWLLQLEQTPSWMQDLFDSEWAFLILLILCILEGLMMLRFMPSELLVPSAIFFIGSTIPKVTVILAIAIVGTTIGQVLLFFFIRRGGREVIVQSRWSPVNERQLDKFDSWFSQWGMIAVPLSNTMLFVRGLFTLPAGLSNLSWKKFAMLSALGSASFHLILAGVYIHAGQLVA